MKRVCYGFDWSNSEMIFAIRRVERAFACFTILKDVNEDFGEVEILAREEDIPTIERMLAPYI